MAVASCFIVMKRRLGHASSALADPMAPAGSRGSAAALDFGQSCLELFAGLAVALFFGYLDTLAKSRGGFFMVAQVDQIVAGHEIRCQVVGEFLGEGIKDLLGLVELAGVAILQRETVSGKRIFRLLRNERF